MLSFTFNRQLPLILLLISSRHILAQITIANLNWQTADLTNTLFLRKYGEFSTAINNPFNPSGDGFQSSVEALYAISNGELDAVLECWNNSFNPCDRTNGTESAPLGEW